MEHKFKVKIAFLDVGQGDNIIISIPETKEAIVVDCFDAFATLGYLKHEEVKYFRGLIVTHLHVDHYKGVIRLLQNCQQEINIACEQVLFNWPHPLPRKNLNFFLEDHDGHSNVYTEEKNNLRTRKTFFQELRTWAEKNVNICEPLLSKSNYTKLRGSFSNMIEILHPKHAQIYSLLKSGLNNTSGVLKVNGVASCALLTGDLEPYGWKYLEKNNLNLCCDVLKFPHHGAWQKNNDDDPSVEEMLNCVAPSMVVISVGTYNNSSYKHPNLHVFEAIAQSNNRHLFCTQVTGQCAKNIETQRTNIIENFKKYTSETGKFFYEQQKGCPCAGTIVIELGDFVNILGIFHIVLKVVNTF